ncbi:hypothetical protein HGG78_17820 [Vibrio aestuarianus]|nr:hypothetical protein [Vibrio aestuarianus]NKZ51723.1 hypothetical protein [Vibrio aestuarianus]
MLISFLYCLFGALILTNVKSENLIDVKPSFIIIQLSVIGLFHIYTSERFPFKSLLRENKLITQAMIIVTFFDLLFIWSYSPRIMTSNSLMEVVLIGLPALKFSVIIYAIALNRIKNEALETNEKPIRKENDMGFITDLEAGIYNENEEEHDENECECGGLLEHDYELSVISDLCSQDDQIVMTCSECGTSYHCI